MESNAGLSRYETNFAQCFLPNLLECLGHSLQVTFATVTLCRFVSMMFVERSLSLHRDRRI